MTEVVKVIIRERPSSAQSDVVIRHCDSVKNRFFVEDRPFKIGQIFDAKATQEDVYESIQPLVKKFLEGYSCNVMAYGSSGTGKSFTMGLQSDNFEHSNCGIVPRALQEIIEYAQNAENETTVEMSFFEIYNEKVFDLLSDKTDEHINTKGSKLTGEVKRPLTNLLDAELILIEGNKNRRTRPTTMNTNSSRSHGIVVIYRKTKESSSSLYMVDLAGSEGVRRTGHKGEALTEGSHINRGLLGIGNIYQALSDGSRRVPYRDTVVGSVLQDSLTVNGFSTLVICISPMRNDVSETINTLTFAQKVMNLKTNPKILPVLQPDSKMKPTPKKGEVNQENWETPCPIRRPLAASTAVKSRPNYRPNLNKITETPTPIALNNHCNNRSILDLQNSQVMDSPTVKRCFEEMQKTLHKRNIRINSINFSSVDKTLTTSDSDSGELNATVIANVIPNDVKIPVTSPSKYMTKEECIRLVEARLANMTKDQPAQPVVTDEPVVSDLVELIDTDFESDSDVVVQEHSNIETQNTVPEAPEVPADDVHISNNSVGDTFQFKAPAAPAYLERTTDRRRSVRIQRISERRMTIVERLPSPPPLIKRRRTTISKKVARQSIVHSVSKADHCKHVLDLLNKGDMKAIQVLAQIGMKTAYCIITHRSLNGKFKNFKEVAKAPFWRGKGWERFEKANNLC